MLSEDSSSNDDWLEQQQLQLQREPSERGQQHQQPHQYHHQQQLQQHHEQPEQARQREVTRLKYRQQLTRLIKRTSERLTKAEAQRQQVERQIELDRVRFERASARSQRSFRYTLRLRLAVQEGMLNMMREYIANKAAERQKYAWLLRRAEVEVCLPSCRKDEAF